MTDGAAPAELVNLIEIASARWLARRTESPEFSPAGASTDC